MTWVQYTFTPNVAVPSAKVNTLAGIVNFASQRSTNAPATIENPRRKIEPDQRA
jgi:hypothetical protein